MPQKINGECKVFTNNDELFQDMVLENEFLLKIVDTIPAKMYFDPDMQEKITSEKHWTMDLKAKDWKNSLDGEWSAKKKHKMARLDPLCQKSVSQIFRELGKQKQRKKKGMLLSSPSLTRAANIEELQKRLQERVSTLQGKRKACSNNGPLAKKKKVEKKPKHKRVTLPKVNEVEMINKKAVPEKKNGNVVYNKDGKVMYSKLDFSEDGFENNKRGDFAGKKIGALLKKAEKQKEKIENLKSTDPEKANTMEEKERWKKAILKSENVKIKDDPKLLKKSMKKQEKIKQKKSKAWKERKDHTIAKMKACQDKRTKNIQKKIQDKKDRKIKLAKKKGRVVLKD